MGGVRAWATAGLQEPLRPCQRQQGIEEELLRLSGDEVGAELAEDSMVEAWVGQVQPEDVLPIYAAMDGICGLAIGEIFCTLEERGERQTRQRFRRLAAAWEEGAELHVVIDGAETVGYLHGEVPPRERRPRHPLGFFRDRIGGLGL